MAHVMQERRNIETPDRAELMSRRDESWARALAGILKRISYEIQASYVCK